LHNGTADSLVGSGADVETDTTVVDVHTLERPHPVPVEEDGSVAVVEGQVASGELLVAEESTVVATIEREVAEEASRSVVHEYALLSISCTSLNHLEDNVLETGSLSHLPVDAGCSERAAGEVNDKVADLTVEVVLVRVPVVTAIGIWITVNQSDALKARAGLESGDCDSITNQLSVVILDDWRAEKVGTRRKVDESWSGCARVTALTTTVARGDCRIDGGSVVSHTIALGAKVHDIAVDLVASLTKCYSTLSLDVGNPV